MPYFFTALQLVPIDLKSIWNLCSIFLKACYGHQGNLTPVPAS